MSNKEFMSHTNATLGVVTFDVAEDNPMEINTLVHHVIGWMVSPTAVPIPITVGFPPMWFKGRKFFTIFLPEGIVIDPIGIGTSLKLEEAIAHFQEELITQEKKENPAPEYNH